MPDFLVFMDTTPIYTLPREVLAEMAERERVTGLALIESGTIKAIWRLPGEKRNVGIWSARDADELHDALQSLPIFPHARFEVHALATHHLTKDDYSYFTG